MSSPLGSFLWFLNLPSPKLVGSTLWVCIFTLWGLEDSTPWMSRGFPCLIHINGVFQYFPRAFILQKKSSTIPRNVDKSRSRIGGFDSYNYSWNNNLIITWHSFMINSQDVFNHSIILKRFWLFFKKKNPNNKFKNFMMLYFLNTHTHTPYFLYFNFMSNDNLESKTFLTEWILFTKNKNQVYGPEFSARKGFLKAALWFVEIIYHFACHFWVKKD